MVNYEQIFLMLIPEYPTLAVAKEFQEAINRRYHLYSIVPDLHITLESIAIRDDRDVEIAKKLIREICHNVEPFPIVIDGFACFGPPYKSVHLHVTKTEPLVNFYQKIHSSLEQVGLVVREYPEGVIFHITIASSCFPGRNWSEEEYHQVCEELQQLPLESGFILNDLELWYPAVNREEKLVERFTLNEKKLT